MDNQLYQKYLVQFINEAIDNSDGSNASIASYLWEIRVGGVLTRHKVEKERALKDARQAFDEHRHWPREIVLSHLGVKIDSE